VPVSVNIIKNGQVQGTLILVTDISDLRTRFLKTMGFVIVASLMAAFLGVMLSVPLQRRITRPILRLSDTMTAIKDSRDYKSTIPEAGDAETSVMVESFNNLMSDIRFRDASLSKLAYYDPMTGLPNRSNFSKELEERLAKVQGGADSLAVSLLNVDAFHAFNDAFGHSIGDAILMNVAAIISAEAGASAFVARVGGDEFAIILGDNGTGQQAESMLARIHAAFFQPIKFLGVEIHLTMSSGTTLLPRDTSNAGDALRFVDLATNAAKKLGPGRSVFFSKDMDDSVRRETELSQNLRVAIQKSELQTFLQPQLHLATGKVTGFEALLRWKHSTQGHISPAIFIPLAERSGSIAALGSWVLDDSCRIAKSWGKGHMESRSIAVNVSPAQLLVRAATAGLVSGTHGKRFHWPFVVVGAGHS
jgi:diguanylate cyclase (GGDEF)-like protein